MLKVEGCLTVMHKAKHVGVFLKIEDHAVVCPLCMVRKSVFLKATVSMP